ncbi:unnamed protein product [Amoebophrya sp. A25]|nr:unnamed protein product [Amoebophrya sp. A25]CAD7976106.1 unnamed protein product [Amoebophrya sp. A25]|eukprot:GSA25T00027024001.1
MHKIHYKSATFRLDTLRHPRALLLESFRYYNTSIPWVSLIYGGFALFRERTGIHRTARQVCNTFWVYIINPAFPFD